MDVLRMACRIRSVALHALTCSLPRHRGVDLSPPHCRDALRLLTRRNPGCSRPVIDNLAQRAIVEGEERFPEARTRCRRGSMDVQAMVDQNQLWLSGRPRRMKIPAWIAVDVSPQEHLGRVGRSTISSSSILESQSQSPAVVVATPVVALRLDLDARVSFRRIPSPGGYRDSLASRRHPAAPGPRDSVFVPEPYAFYPFGGHDALELSSRYTRGMYTRSRRRFTGH